MFVDNLKLPEDFSGQVRLFPLPELVLFPRLVLPLHIFEPRYCDMLEEALQTDRLITMATLIPDDLDPEKIDSHVCIGRIIKHEPTLQGTHNLILAGLQRAVITREQPRSKPFREAFVEIMPSERAGEIPDAQQLCEELITSFTEDRKVIDRLQDLVASDFLDLAAITDLVAFYSRMKTEFSLKLLAESDPYLRAMMLLSSFSGPAEKTFPPPFSLN